MKIIEGDKQTLIIETDHDFDYTGRNNYFTAKAKLLDKTRLIDILIPDEDVTYNNIKTIFNIKLNPEQSLVAYYRHTIHLFSTKNDHQDENMHLQIQHFQINH